MTDRRAVLAGVGGLALTASLSACGRTEVPIDDQGRVRLRFATDTMARAEHGGFYQALASGAYGRRGLNVEIVQGQPGADVAPLLASGTVELGLGSDGFGPLGLVGADAPVKAVAAFFQTSPLALLAHPQDPPVETLETTPDRTVLVPDGAVTTLWPWLMSRYGFTESQLRRDTGDVAAFAADDQAVLVGDVAHDPARIAQQAEFEPQVFPLAQDGFSSYGAIVLAPNGFARDNAAALRSFLAASVEGWRDYIKSDPAPANALIRKANLAMTQDSLDQARLRLRDDGIVDGGDAALYGLGAMTPERWQAFFETMVAAGVYPATLDWRDAFTDAFLPGRR